jgi:Lhr-like helicase
MMNFTLKQILKTIYNASIECSINIQVQNDAFILSAPSRNEINFKFGFGAQSQI